MNGKLLFLVFIVFLTGPAVSVPAAEDPSKFSLSSPEVKDGGTLPYEFTGFGANATLPLEWKNVPAGTKSFSLIMHHIDPEGKSKWYWILFNIPADVTALPKNVKGVGLLGNNSVNGKNEYAPPHSKGGGLKTYIYTVYALSGSPEFKVPAEKVNREVLLEAMKGKVLASAQFSVNCTRPEGAEGKDGDRPPPPPRDNGPAPKGTAGFQIVDRGEFEIIMDRDSKLETIGSNFRFTEGPVWLDKEKKLVFSDIDAEKLFQWTKTGGLSVYREKTGGANGNCLDLQGRIISCGQNSRMITRSETDGKTTVLADKFEGKKLNSPNDAVVSSDGSIWFTDPDYGLKGTAGELPGRYVFKIDGKGALAPVIKELNKPNGICFSPDEKYLYVADSGDSEHLVKRYLMMNGLPAEGKVFCVIDNKAPDGIRCDKDGRLYAAAGDGIHIFSAEGKLLGKILTPSWPTNLCFGGEDGKTLFITARDSVYHIQVKIDGRR